MLPSTTDPRWTRLIENPGRYSYNMLALRVMMQRISLKVRLGMTVNERRDVLSEVQSFFAKNERMLQDDIRSIFG